VVVTIQPSNISGVLSAPASKSSMQRACAAALLSQGTSIIRNPGHSNDDKASLDVIRALGADVSLTDDETLEIKSNGINPESDSVNCGESGLGIRMFTPIISLSNKPVTINGEGSLLNRPMNFFDEILPRLGVQIISKNGKLPLKIKGPLVPANVDIDGSLSSQFLTGLLFAFAAADAKNVSIKVANLKSHPYIDLTLQVMEQFGLKTPENKSYKEFYFSSSDFKKHHKNNDYTVEGDWSGGAFLLVAGSIAGPITVRGLDMLSTQADRVILEALMKANASIAIEAKGIKVRPGRMKSFEFDATDCPDLFPPLVALASYCNGTSIIKGVERLTHKESNRAITLQEEFGKMGVPIELKNNVMEIIGTGKLKGAKVHSHHDHRIAMACAIAALRAEGNSVIEEANAIDKSYPDFFKDLMKLGTNVSLGKTFKPYE
jgi:3-phosphoshikimate 1-carboxyvinyltransferase